MNGLTHGTCGQARIAAPLGTPALKTRSASALDLYGLAERVVSAEGAGEEELEGLGRGGEKGSGGCGCVPT